MATFWANLEKVSIYLQWHLFGQPLGKLGYFIFHHLVTRYD